MTAADDRVVELERVIGGVLMGSLLDVRRAAFGPEIGVRYTEAIRADIAGACRRLEDVCRDALESQHEPPGDGDEAAAEARIEGQTSLAL